MENNGIISADGGYGEKGGKGGEIHIIEIKNDSSITNNTTFDIKIIINKYEQIIKQIDDDQSLTPDQKSEAKNHLEKLKDVLITAAPYVQSFLSPFLGIL